jgi:ABC-type polysaccharide/polyol phosphate transport system ATPase subunit
LEAGRGEVVSEARITVDSVSLAYRIARDRAGSMKEFAINLLKRQVVYESLWALEGVSFQIEKGEVFGVIGPNGAGKSTLMKVLAGVLPPSSGRVLVRGIVSPMIEVSGGMNPEMTGRENIVLFGTLLGRDPDEMRKRIGPIAEWAELTEFLDAPIRNYSTGMTTRLAFAIATDVKPEILLVDEVLAVGDENFRRKSTERIDDLMMGGTTLVLVSHSLATVRKMADRVMWLDHGHCKMIGDSDLVVSAYEASV